jgi:transcription initiation factor TFIIA large subunit
VIGCILVQTPLQTPIQTPLPGTDAGMYNILTGPSDYAPSPISDVRSGMAMNGADPKTGRPSPYMVGGILLFHVC